LILSCGLEVKEDKNIVLIQNTDKNSIDSLKSMERARFSGMLFAIPSNKSLIAIDFVSIYDKKAFEKFGLVATYNTLGLEELGHDAILIFKFSLPCIYFEEEKKLLVINREKTEAIFNLLEHYQEKAMGKFEELVESKIIKLDNAILQGEIKNITTARKINIMIETELFTTNIELYKKHEQLIKNHPEWDDELTQLSIEKDQVVIDTIDKFQSFLTITSFDIVNPAVDPTQHYISSKKRKIKIDPKKITRS